VADQSDVKVAADESVQDAASALAAIRRGGVAVVNIKLMKCGIAEALDIAAVARATGTGLMIGGMVETRLAMGASACFAAGLGGFSFVDLDTPMFLATDPFRGGYAQDGERILLQSVTAGHGVTPDPAFFGP
jgi:L-Ala-D/L-Glu epimerase